MNTVETATPAEQPNGALIVASTPKESEVTPLKTNAGKYVELDVKSITTKAGDNVRTGELPDMENLAASIAAEGILEPIIVTAAEVPGKYSVVAGFRRLFAVRSLGGTTIPAIIIDADADRKLRLALIENIQREDMNPLDKANAVAKLQATSQMTPAEIGALLGVTSAFVFQHLNLLQLPDIVKDSLRDGSLIFSHARTLCRLLPDKKAIEELFKEADNMSPSQLEAKVSHLVDLAKKLEVVEIDDEEDGETKPKKTKKAKAAPTEDTLVKFYAESEFRPLKKEEIRALMENWARKVSGAESETKRAEHRLVLKGIAMAADLRLK